MRGYSRVPGLVRGEACCVQLQNQLPPGVDYVGVELPRELFHRPIDATVHDLGVRRKDGRYEVAVRLLDEWLKDSLHPQLSRLYGAEPPSPFPYEVTPIHFLNGWTSEPDIRTGDECFLWIKAEGDVPWLERKPDQLPSAFPTYPHEHLVGFWGARVLAIAKSKGDAPVRNLRAVLIDDRIRDHANQRVRQLYGHEPWTDYAVTLMPNELLAAGEEMVSDLVGGTRSLLRRLPKQFSFLD